MPTNVTYPGVYIQELPAGTQPIPGVPTAICAFVGTAAQGPFNQPVEIGCLAAFQRQFGTSPADTPAQETRARETPLDEAVRLFFENGGGTAIVVRLPRTPSPDAPPPDASTLIGDPVAKSGLHALDTQRFNLLCLPPFEHGHDHAPETWAAAADYCFSRKAILLIDPPSSWTADRQTALAATQAGIVALQQAIGAGTCANAALYFPPLRLPGEAATGSDRIPPSGAIAGIIARSDAEHGVWKAPAGLHTLIAGIADLAYPLTDGETALLNPLGLNCLRSFPGHGHVVWGARTLAGNDTSGSDWTYLPIRRLVLFIEESLAAGTAWTVFEPNDERLWAKLHLVIGDFLQRLFLQGAFQGTVAHDAYFLKCDRSTVTQSDIDQGIVNVVIGLAPLKPAEFVVISLRLIAGQSET